MEFNGLQLAAMVNAGMAMILADGKIQADERCYYRQPYGCIT